MNIFSLTKRLLLIIIGVLILSSCGISMIQKVNTTSRQVNALNLLASKDKVIAEIGPPHAKKAQFYEGGQLEILYYKTFIQVASIGIEYAAGFTPLYFYDGTLMMIGDQVMAQYLDPIQTMNAFSNAFPSRQSIDVTIRNR